MSEWVSGRERQLTFCSVSSCSLSLSYSSQASASSTNKLALDRNSSRPLIITYPNNNKSANEDNTLEMGMQQNDEWDYLIRSFLALSAWEAAKPASLSAIFFLFHSINSAGVICVAVFSFARWNIEQENNFSKWFSWIKFRVLVAMSRRLGNPEEC